MVIPDANLILYAHNDRSEHHVTAKAWFRDLLNGDELVGIDWNVVLAFVRVSTHPKLGPGVLKVEQSFAIVNSWFESPNFIVLNPSDQHLKIMSDLLFKVGLGNNLVSDAHLAALAIENRATLCSHDRDFQRFSGFRLVDPLAKSR